MEQNQLSNHYRAESNPMIVASLLFANPTTPQTDINEPRKRIDFAPCKVTATVNHALPHRRIVHQYALSGKAGCALQIQLMAADSLTFSLVSPESRFVSNCNNKREWAGELPITGTYYLYVSHKGSSKAPYQLEVAMF